MLVRSFGGPNRRPSRAATKSRAGKLRFSAIRSTTATTRSSPISLAAGARPPHATAMAAVSAPAAAPVAAASLRTSLSARPHSVSFATLPRTAPPTLRLSLGARSVRCLAAGGGGAGPDMRATLDKVVGAHKVVLFMKGTKDFPQCGFSHTVVQILRSLDVPFETLDVLSNEALRQGLKDYSSWPTFPQLYIDGEFFGGCDITVEAYKSGELQETLEKAMCS
uniref:Uncharacterized protein n=1 Tax=Avena sativa TaxID=4498 RepID=A0ACD6A8P1_AVESA